MVIVPEYNRQYVEQGAAPVRVTAPQGNPLSELSKGVGAAADALFNAQDDFDTAAAKNADAAFTEKLNDLLYNEQTGYMFAQGGDAIGRRGSVSEQIDSLFESSFSGMTGGARQKAETAMRARKESVRTQVNRHAVGERNNYLDAATDARIASSLMFGSANPDGLNLHLGVINQDINEKAARNGWAPEVTALAKQEAADKAVSDAVLRAENVDVWAAQRILAQHQNKLSDAAKAKIEERLLPKIKAARGRAAGDAAFAAASLGAGVMPAGFDWASHITGGGTRPDAITGLDDGFELRLAHMFASAPAGVREGLQVFSGYRSNEKQAELYASAQAKHGANARKWVAPPGASMHNHGKAVDIMWNGQRIDKAPANVREWLHANAGNFGVYFPMAHEPWHAEVMGTRGGKPFVPPATSIFGILDNPDLSPEEKDAAVRQFGLRRSAAATDAAEYEKADAEADKTTGLALGDAAFEDGKTYADVAGIDDPEQRDWAIKRYEQRRAAEKADDQVHIDAVSESVLEGVRAGRDITSIPGWEDLPPSAFSAVSNYQTMLEGNEEPDKRTRAEAYGTLLEMAATDQAAFKSVRLINYVDKLSLSEFQHFTDMQAKVRAGTPMPDISSLLAIAAPGLATAKISIKDTPERYRAFYDSLYKWAAANPEAASDPSASYAKINSLLAGVVINPAGAGNQQGGSGGLFGADPKTFSEISFDGDPVVDGDEMTFEQLMDPRTDIGINGRMLDLDVKAKGLQILAGRLGRDPTPREVIEYFTKVFGQ